MGPTPPPTAAAWRRHLTPGRVFFLVSLVHALWAVHLGWDHAILDNHPFRQSQTALTASYMVGRPPKLAYETPVLGPPWSIPMEFPLYQWIVAGLVTVLGTPLEQTGRFVSVAFFLLTLVPANLILRRCEVSAEGRLVILGLFLLSPFYLFWSRTFMIESTALFLSVSYVAAAWSALESPRPLRVATALLFGGLAGPVKVTTFATFLLAAGLLAVRAWWLSRRPEPRAAWGAGRLATAALLLAFPVVTTALWTHFADAQKELNPLGKALTSTTLREWNFGTLAQRADLGVWGTQFSRAIAAVDVPVLLAGLGGLLLTRRRWRLIAVCTFLYLSAFLLFCNVYRHTYYPYANNIFLLGAAGLGVVALLEANRPLRALAPALLLGFFGLECYRHSDLYGWIQESNVRGAADAGRAIEGATQEDEVLVGLGLDWTSEYAYCSRRRALMRPGSAAEGLGHFRECLAQLDGYRVGAVAIKKSTLAPYSIDDAPDLLAKCGWHGRVVYSDAYMTIYAASAEAAVEGPRSPPER
ncbi:MAG TPA: hypothetical protein VKA46_10540 [Gemmataceae bacterium]|nr:hypothetical protein [Gemmataceae bacterium]